LAAPLLADLESWLREQRPSCRAAMISPRRCTIC
jgi:hypothetical protein